MAKTFITSGTGASQTLDPIQNEKVPVYNTRSDAEADIANIVDDGIVFTKDTGATEKVVDVVEDGNMNPVTSNGVYDYVNPTTITLTAGPNATYFEYTAYKVGKMIFINGNVTGTFNPNDVYFTVPNEAKPSSSKRSSSTISIVNSGVVPVDLAVDSTGFCKQFQTGGTVASASFSFAYSI